MGDLAGSFSVYPSMTGTITCDRTNFTLQQWAGHEAVVREPGDVVAIQLPSSADSWALAGGAWLLFSLAALSRLPPHAGAPR